MFRTLPGKSMQSAPVTKISSVLLSDLAAATQNVFANRVCENSILPVRSS
jgi:hypothetical protein